MTDITAEMIQPLHDNVLLKRDAPRDSTPGGIVLPDNIKQSRSVFFAGEVLATGPGRMTEDGGRAPCHVKAGDHVAFKITAPKWTQWTFRREKYVILSERDLEFVYPKDY